MAEVIKLHDTDRIEKARGLLRENGIEPEIDFLVEFAKFETDKQTALIEVFKKYPDIESRYHFIDRGKNENL